MKKFTKILLYILVIIVLVVVIAYLLPKTYRVERSVYIKSKADVIYKLTSNFKLWHLWVAWTKESDSTAVFVITGPDAATGAGMKWTGKELGVGEMVTSSLIPEQEIAYDLSFDNGAYRSKGKITIEKTGDSCLVSWIDEGVLGYNPVSRYMGLLMDRMMGPDFEKGLAKLKTISEKRADWPKIEQITMTPLTTLIILDSAGPETYGSVMGKAFGEIMTFAESKKLKITGSPFAMYLKWDSVTMRSTMNIGIPVEKAVTPNGRVKVLEIPAQDVVKAQYFGPYDKTGPVYYILEQYIREIGKTPSGGPWEIYVTDPMTEKDPMKCETTILFPVK